MGIFPLIQGQSLYLHFSFFYITCMRDTPVFFIPILTTLKNFALIITTSIIWNIFSLYNKFTKVLLTSCSKYFLNPEKFILNSYYTTVIVKVLTDWTTLPPHVSLQSFLCCKVIKNTFDKLTTIYLLSNFFADSQIPFYHILSSSFSYLSASLWSTSPQLPIAPTAYAASELWLILLPRISWSCLYLPDSQSHFKTELSISWPLLLPCHLYWIPTASLGTHSSTPLRYYCILDTIPPQWLKLFASASFTLSII